MYDLLKCTQTNICVVPTINQLYSNKLIRIVSNGILLFIWYQAIICVNFKHIQLDELFKNYKTLVEISLNDYASLLQSSVCFQ